MKIIGFSGYARVGKDSAAEALSSLGFVRLSFADKLRDFIYELNPTVWSGMDHDNLRSIIDFYGWDGCKETKWAYDIRRQLQVLGTECGRMIIGDDIWVNALFDNLPNPFGQYVLADVRFPNEADGIRRRGGLVFRIERSGVEAINAHPSETALDDYKFDGIIHNDGTKAEFKANVRRKVIECVSKTVATEPWEE